MVGQNVVLTCSSDTGVVDRIQWVSRDGVVLASNTSVQQLQFMLRPVNDSLSVHTSFFTCSLTKDEGTLNQTISNQTQPVTVASRCLLIHLYFIHKHTHTLLQKILSNAHFLSTHASHSLTSSIPSLTHTHSLPQH